MNKIAQILAALLAVGFCCYWAYCIHVVSEKIELHEVISRDQHPLSGEHFQEDEK